MKLLGWRGGVLGQFWSSFAIVLVVNQLAVLGGMYLFLFKPATASFSTLATALVDAGYRMQQGGAQPGLGVITPYWISNDHIIVVSGEVADLRPLPPYPGLRLIARGIEEQMGAQVRVGFKNEPEQTLWIQHRGARPFAVGVPMAERLQGFKLLLVAVFVTLLLSGAAAWVVAAHLTRPLAHLSDMARRVGQGESVGEITVDEGSPTEVLRLAAALNQMRDEIEQMLRERERFLAGITHDLRTPLSRMRVALELGEARESELNEGLRDDIEEMRAILDQFIELSRLDMEQSEQTQTGDLNAVVLDIAHKYQRAGETLRFEPGQVPDLRFKPMALKRLLYNLIDNALRHGFGDVVITTQVTDQDQVCLTVMNLQAASQRDSALVAALRWAVNEKQSGLGLAIVRRLAEVHEAEVSIETQPDGSRQVAVIFTQTL
jgi:two-component system osmolarity sensor histidine kinase EnvZ